MLVLHCSYLQDMEEIIKLAGILVWNCFSHGHPALDKKLQKKRFRVTQKILQAARIYTPVFQSVLLSPLGAEMESTLI